VLEHTILTDLFVADDRTNSQSSIKLHTLGYVKILGAESKGILLCRQRQMDRRPKIRTVPKINGIIINQSIIWQHLFNGIDGAVYNVEKYCRAG
jgi:hypothetical protein